MSLSTITRCISRLRKRSGFSLVESLVIISIVGLLSAYTISYSNVSRRQTEMYVSKAQIGQFILKAKSLTLNTRTRGSLGRPCGYGVDVNEALPPSRSSLTLFSYSVPTAEVSQGLGGSCLKDGVLRKEQVEIGRNGLEKNTVESFELPQEVEFFNSATRVGMVKRIFFLAPDPQTFIWVDGSADPGALSGRIYLITEDERASSSIFVTSAGEVSF
ncbi:MAG: type II secretion system GspH family protein [Patescibacteria group bacterium]|nr:type II secretion system GspH family protein [Patescibacteria group bacterium]